MAWRDWLRTVEIEPSLYAADFARLGEQVRHLLNAGARVFHFDVGDGHFVEPVTIGPVVLQAGAPLIHADGRLRELRAQLHDRVVVQVDGGITQDNVRAAHEAGADAIVAGSAIFGRQDLNRAYLRLVRELAPRD